jgi:hypothetical protein
LVKLGKGWRGEGRGWAPVKLVELEGLAVCVRVDRARMCLKFGVVGLKRRVK